MMIMIKVTFNDFVTNKSIIIHVTNIFEKFEALLLIDISDINLATSYPSISRRWKNIINDQEKTKVLKGLECIKN